MSRLIRQFIALLCFVLSGAAFGGAGELDASFSGDGVHIAPMECCEASRASAIVPLPDGRLLAVGNAVDGSRLSVVAFRLAVDGSLDSTFGSGGTYRLQIGHGDSYAAAMALQPDGKIVLTGSYQSLAFPHPNRIVVARLLATGVPDTTFGTNGVVQIESHGIGDTLSIPRALVLDSLGRILVGGSITVSNSSSGFVTRLTASGSLDPTFGSNGTTVAGGFAGYALAMSPDGSIVLAGDLNGFAAVARFTTAGTLDATFDGDGVRGPIVGSSGNGRAVAVLADGRVLVGGSAGGNATLFRLLTNGTPDTTYNGTGIVTMTPGRAEALVDAADGFTYVLTWNGGGYVVGNARLHRVSQAGIVDAAFSNASDGVNQFAIDGTNQDRAGDLAIDAAGSLFIGTNRPSGSTATFGYTGVAQVIKRGPDGLPAAGFGLSGTVNPPLGIIRVIGEYEAVAVASDRSITVMHPSDCPPVSNPSYCGRITRLLADGTPDPALDAKLVMPLRRGTEPSTPRTLIRLQPSGKILYAHSGIFSGTDEWAVSRLNADGTPDGSFTIPLLDGDNPPITGVEGVLEVYPDGRFLFGSTRNFGRYHADGGNPDANFNLGVPIFDTTRTGMLPLASGGILYGRTNGQVVKLTGNGNLDPAFGISGSVSLNVGANSTTIERLAILGDGRVLVAGRAFDSGPSSPNFGVPFIAWLTAAGALDTTFAVGGVFRLTGYRSSQRLGGIAVQSDGRIVLAGTDEPIAGPRGFVARLDAPGTLDGTFGNSGVMIVDRGFGGELLRAMQIDANGDIVLGGVVGKSTFPPTPAGYAVLRLRGAASARDIQPAELPVGGRGIAYAAQLVASGGTAPYTFALSDGTLPPGLALASNGQLSGTPTLDGRFTFTVRATDAGSVSHAKVLGLQVHSANTLLESYYATILGRSSDFVGRNFWLGEIQRMSSLGASVSEVFYSMAAAFFASPEYSGRNPSDVQFITDMYRTFFGRDPDASGLSFWSAELAAGKPRGAALNDFMFSAEFADYMLRIFGASASARAEVSMVLDFYRGLLGRLPDTNGFNHWRQRFRAAQCNGTVSTEASAISAAFIYSDEYNGKQNALAPAQRTTGYVIDLYNAFLKRGGDRTGFQFWVNAIDSGQQSREQVRQSFIASPEFQGRVQAVVAQGCVP